MSTIFRHVQFACGLISLAFSSDFSYSVVLVDFFWLTSDVDGRIMTVNASLQGMDAHTVSLTFILTSVVHINYQNRLLFLSFIFLLKYP